MNIHSICNRTVKKNFFTYAVFICEIRSVYEHIQSIYYYYYTETDNLIYRAGLRY